MHQSHTSASRRAPQRRRFMSVLAAVFAAALAFFSPGAALAFDEVFDSGHVDAFYVTAPDGTLHLSMKEDITGSAVPRSGDDVVLKVVEDAWSDATEGVPEIGNPPISCHRPKTSASSGRVGILNPPAMAASKALTWNLPRSPARAPCMSLKPAVLVA